MLVMLMADVSDFVVGSGGCVHLDGISARMLHVTWHALFQISNALWSYEVQWGVQ